jgi:CheY-like chemotaxis protein
MSASGKAGISKNNPPLIFVVDDNPDLTQMAELILADEGYQCQLFCDPEQVLQAFQNSSVRPDLLLTDFDMGSMNGLELTEHCRRTLPELKVVLVSGTVEAAAVLSHPVKINEFLSKPYRPKDLAALVRTLLAQ